MGSMRVHELAKEFGLSSKEMLDKLAEMKIPAKNHASTLVDAYVDKVRKQLGPEMAERAARIEREAQEAAAAEAAKAEAERQRIQEELWQTDEFVDDNTLTVNVSHLRQTLASIGARDFVQTRRGLGYLV